MTVTATLNGAYDTVANAAGTGTSVTPATPGLWPDPATVGPYPVSIWPTSVAYTSSNGMRAMVTAKTAGVLTIERQTEGSSSRNIQIGDQMMLGWGAQDAQSSLMNGERNLLINPGFQFAQALGTSASTLATGGAHGPDGWYVLTQTGNCTYARGTPPNSPAKGLFNGVLTNAAGSAQRLLMLQVIPNVRTQALRGEPIRAEVMLASDVTVNGRVAILEWTGTADSVTKTIIDTWTSTTYTPGAGNFFSSTTKNLVGVSGSVALTTAPAIVTARGVVGASANNLIIVAWTEGTIANSAVLTLQDAWCVPDVVHAPYTPRDRASEIRLCQQYYCKSFELSTAPAQNVGVNTGYHYFPATIAGANLNILGRVYYPVPMRATPTVTTYNPAAANAQIRDLTNSVDFSATTVNNQNSQGHSMFGTGNAGTTVGAALAVHWTADARL